MAGRASVVLRDQFEVAKRKAEPQGTTTSIGLWVLLPGDPDTYRYIPESLRRYPGAEAVTTLLRACGLVDAQWFAVLGGLMAR